MFISLIIPIYNEEDNINKLYLEIKNAKIYQYINEIIYIDDCSIDNSLDNINKLKQNDNKIKILKNKIRKGQSFSIHFGCKMSSNEVVATIDGDGQNNPNDLIDLYKIYANNVDIKLVGGLRVKRKDNYIKILSSRLANNFRKAVLNDNCNDTGCSLKIFDKNVFLSFQYFNGIHRFLPALYLGSGYKTSFVNVDHRNRVYGQSKYGTFKRFIFGLLDTYKVYKMINKK